MRVIRFICSLPQHRCTWPVIGDCSPGSGLGEKKACHAVLPLVFQSVLLPLCPSASLGGSVLWLWKMGPELVPSEELWAVNSGWMELEV